MKTKFVLCFALVLGNGLLQQVAAFGSAPPMPSLDLLGTNEVKIENYWLAPYVRVSEGFSGTTVTWFDDNGRIKRKAVVSGVEPGFVDAAGKKEMILGVNEDWTITLPSEPPNTDPHYDLSGYITSTPDSRVFIHEYHPKGGLVSLDIYIHGKLVNTVGPFVQHLADEVALNDDGSASLVVWKNESKTNTQAVMLDTNGNIATSENTSQHSEPMPEIGPNAFRIGEIPGSHKTLFRTSIGFETNRYHLIDQGKQLWDIPCPGDGATLAVGLTPKFVVLAVTELYKPGPWRGSEWVFRNNGKEWIRMFYAIDVDDGRIVARWRADYPCLFNDADRDRFLMLDNKLYFITADEFTEFNFDDIVAKRNGWK